MDRNSALAATSGNGTDVAPAASAGSPARNGGIDALRAAVTLLVVLHHAAITYGASGGWYYREVAPSASPGGILLILFCATNQAWFMGLFFLLAGTYTPDALRRHGAWGFIRSRLLRLGIPLLAYVFLLHPVTVALAQTAQGRSFVHVLLYLFEHGKFEPGPLWFVEALLIFTAAWLLWRSVGGAAPSTAGGRFPSDTTLLAAALLTGAGAFLLRLAWPVGETVAFLQLGYFSSYVVLFAAGCMAADGAWLERIPQAGRVLWLRVAAGVFPILPAVVLLAPHFPLPAGSSDGGWSIQALTYAFWEPFVAWGVILGLLGLFQRRFAHLTGMWRRLARRAFLIYIIHPPMLVGTALAWRDIPAPALVKFAVTGSVACALCYLAAGLLLRLPGFAKVV